MFGGEALSIGCDFGGGLWEAISRFEHQNKVWVFLLLIPFQRDLQDSDESIPITTVVPLDCLCH